MSGRFACVCSFLAVNQSAGQGGDILPLIAGVFLITASGNRWLQTKLAAPKVQITASVEGVSSYTRLQSLDKEQGNSYCCLFPLEGEDWA